jgi:hypothetical protein
MRCRCRSDLRKQRPIRRLVLEATKLELVTGMACADACSLGWSSAAFVEHSGTNVRGPRLAFDVAGGGLRRGRSDWLTVRAKDRTARPRALRWDTASVQAGFGVVVGPEAKLGDPGDRLLPEKDRLDVRQPGFPSRCRGASVKTRRSWGASHAACLVQP